jgi:hypothetical protein
VIFRRDLGDQVDDIGHATGTFAALLEGTVNLCGNNDFPRISAKEGEDDLLDFAVGYHVALTDEHGPWSAFEARA